MTVETFSKEQFEEFLDSYRETTEGYTHPWKFLGLVDGEYAYLLPLDEEVFIHLRSSIKANGYSAGTGEDSIRAWLVNQRNDTLGSKTARWVTRVSGWEARLSKTLDTLASWRAAAGNCPSCDVPKRMFKVRKNGGNKGRIFAKCTNEQCSVRNGGFVWLDEIAPPKTDKKEVEDTLPEENGGLEDLLDMAESELVEEDYRGAQERMIELDLDPQPNPKQLEAIQQPVGTNVRVFAGPGAGKTFTLSRRYEFIVKEGVPVNDILLITFTKSMADEMVKKITQLVPGAEVKQISTIHAFCYRELTQNNPELSYFRWSVAGVGNHSPIKSWEIKKKLTELIEDYWPQSEKDKPAYKEVLGWINTAKYEGVAHRESQRWFCSFLGAFWGVPLSKIRVDFDNWLYDHKCMLFSDMLYLMEQELIHNPDFKAKMKAKYNHIIIDEGQDTNYQAFKILFHILEAASLFLVADVNQMMFRFQGAKPELVTGEIDEYVEGIKTIILDTNYRSHEEIVNSFQSLIQYNYTDNGGPYEQKFFQDIRGIKSEGGSISFEMADTIFGEGKGIAEEISVLLENGYKAGDIFVGARTKAQLGYLEGELIKKGLKFINIAGGSFWDGKNVKDVVSYLRLAHDPGDSEALKRVANIASNNHLHTWGRNAGEYSPTRFLGKEFLEKIKGDFNNIDRFLMTARDAWRYQTKDRDYSLYGPSKAQDLQEFVWALQEAILGADHVGQLVDIILDDCYLKYLRVTEGSAEDEESNIVDNLRTVSEIASQYTRVEDFLAYVDEMTTAAEKMKDKDWQGYIVISTYHRLKGLERKVIFGMGWCEGDNGFGEPAGLLPHTFSLIDPPQFGVLPTGGKSPVEDERCIAFVCISRAKERVYLSGCREYRFSKFGPSRFVEEVFNGNTRNNTI